MTKTFLKLVQEPVKAEEVFMTYQKLGRRLVVVSGIRINLEVVRELEKKYRVIMRVL